MENGEGTTYLKKRSGWFIAKLISHVSDCICHISEYHNGKVSRFILVTSEANDGHGSTELGLRKRDSEV